MEKGKRPEVAKNTLWDDRELKTVRFVIIIIENGEEYYYGGLQPAVTHSITIKTKDVERASIFEVPTLYTIGTHLQMLVENLPKNKYLIKSL